MNSCICWKCSWRYSHGCVSGVVIMANHLSKHHDDAEGVQETGGVPLIQSDLCLHRCPGAAAEVFVLCLRARTLRNDIFITGANALLINQWFRAAAEHVLPPHHSNLH